jgi:hypothetical protein
MYRTLGSPVLNNTGQVAFVCSIRGPGVTVANFEASYAGPLASPLLLARGGNPAPGTPAGTTYEIPFYPDLNEFGQVAYLATFAGSGITGSNKDGIYAGSPASPMLVARTGDPAPGAPPGTTYNAFLYHPALNNLGQVAYLSRLSSGGGFELNNYGLYAGPPASPALIAHSGNPAPGQPPA